MWTRETIMNVIRLETLDDLIEEHVKSAKEHFETYGEYYPMIIGYFGTQRIVMPILFNNDQEKEQLLRIVTMSFAAYNVTRYTFANEGYMLKSNTAMPEYDKLKSEEKRISDHPDRVECLMCAACSYNDKKMIIYEINEDRSLTKSDMRADSNVSGRFFELLPDPKIPKEVRELIKSAIVKFGVKIDIEDLKLH